MCKADYAVEYNISWEYKTAVSYIMLLFTCEKFKSVLDNYKLKLGGVKLVKKHSSQSVETTDRKTKEQMIKE